MLRSRRNLVNSWNDAIFDFLSVEFPRSSMFPNVASFYAMRTMNEQQDDENRIVPDKQMLETCHQIHIEIILT